MILGRAVYDRYGRRIMNADSTLAQDFLDILESRGVNQLFIKDPRVDDILVHPLFAPEREGEAAQALRRLLSGIQESRSIADTLLSELRRPIRAMADAVFPLAIGEPWATGASSREDYANVHPVRVAGMTMLLGQNVGLDIEQVTNLAMAAVLMNIGDVVPSQTAQQEPNTVNETPEEAPDHPEKGSELLSAHGRLEPEVVDAVLQHHELWDGSGYPRGLKGTGISLFARILRIADTYYQLMSRFPNRETLLPHQSVEFIMAFSGDMFDPELVRLFLKFVPLYTNGVTVVLNSGEIGIVSDSNLPFIGRPVVRICVDKDRKSLKDPYDIDLADTKYQSKLVVQSI